MAKKPEQDGLSELRKRAEAKLAGGETTLGSASTEEMSALLLELQTHEIELELQNEELRKAQEELAASRELYVSLYDFAPVGYATVSSKGIVQQANLRLTEMLGVPRAQLVGRPLSAFVAAEDADLYHCHRRAVSSSDTPTACELRMERPDGTMFWAAMECVADESQREGESVYRCSVSDISDRKEAEEKLLASREEFAEIFAMSLDLVCVADINKATFLKVNPSFTRVLGYDEAELVNHPFSEFIHPDDIEPTRKVVEEELRQGKTLMSFTNRYRRKDGTWCWLEWAARPLPERGVTFSVAHDVTERKRVQGELRRERDFAETLVETAQTIVLVLDTEGRIVRFNPYMEQLSGYRLDEVKGRDWFSTFLPVDDHAKIREVFQRAVHDIQTHGNVNAILTKDGRERGIEWYDHVLKNAQGEVVGVLATGQDVTDRRQREEELRAKDALLSKAQELGKIGTWELDIVNSVLVWTEENYSVFGVPTGTPLTYEVFLSCVHPDDRDYVDREWTARMKANDYDIEHRLLVDGEVRWVREKAEVTFDEAGNPVRAIGFAQDITERKLAEHALRESEDFLNRTGDIALVGGWHIDLDKQKVLWTRTTGKIHELPEGYFPDLEEAFGYYHPDDQGHVRQCVERAIEEGEPFDFTTRLITAKGNERWVRALGQPVFESGKCVRLSGTFQDITEQRQLEERLRQTEKMDAIGQLAGGAAHDFNNQLGGIMNYADLLLAKTTDEELVRYIDAIIRSCTRGKDLTGQLLAFSRKGKYQVVPVNIHQTIPEVVAMLGRSSDKRIAIRQLLEANPPMTTGDPSQLQNALLNLGLNARDAMPDGGELVFTTDTFTLDEAYCGKSRFDIVPGDYLRITVADSGTGMDEETLSRVFEPFFTTKEEGKGTGMGLASVYGTVVNHDGAIEVDSKLGQGTTMTVYLPLSRQEQQEAVKAAGTSPGVKGGARILMVDDEKGVRESTAALLRNKGYKVVTAKDGAEAVEYYEKSWEHVDLVILDMNMPVLNGRDTFVAMRKINPDIKAILATGYSLDSNAQEILDEGALSHIQKPFRIHDLIPQIEQALGG